MMLKPFYLLFHSSQICYPQSTHLFSVVIYWENGSELPTFWPPTLQPYLHVFVPSDRYIPLGMVDNFYLFIYPSEVKVSSSNDDLDFPSLFFDSKILFQGLLWWYSGQESAYQYRGHGFDPDQGTKIPNAMRQLSPPITRNVCQN